MQRGRSQIWLGVLFGLALPLSAGAQGFSRTEFQYQGGSAWVEGALSPPGYQHAFTLQHASAWSHGSNFFFVDLVCCDEPASNRDAYLEWYSYLSLGALSGKEISFGPVSNINITGGINWGSQARLVKFTPGIQLALDLPGFAFANLDFVYLADLSAGLEGGGVPKADGIFGVDFNWEVSLPDRRGLLLGRGARRVAEFYGDRNRRAPAVPGPPPAPDPLRHRKGHGGRGKPRSGGNRASGMDQQVRRGRGERVPAADPGGLWVLRTGVPGTSVLLLALAFGACGDPSGPRPPGTVGIPAGGEVDAFFLDRTEVTTARFAAFVAETGYRTDAERLGWSFVFHAPGTEPSGAQVVAAAPWFVVIEEADWRRPRGPDHPPAEDDHPAVQVSWNDAAAFCAAAGGRLPSGAEWAHAARGGRAGSPFPWGDRSPFAGDPPANLWDGLFPIHPGPGDRFSGVAPVGMFPPNPYGLSDMAGNVWEWVDGGGPEDRRLRGGSFLCAENSCQGYRISWENRASADSAWNHTGFRCAF